MTRAPFDIRVRIRVGDGIVQRMRDGKSKLVPPAGMAAAIIERRVGEPVGRAGGRRRWRAGEVLRVLRIIDVFQDSREGLFRSPTGSIIEAQRRHRVRSRARYNRHDRSVISRSVRLHAGLDQLERS